MSTLAKRINRIHLILSQRRVPLIGVFLFFCLTVSGSAGAAADILDGNEDFKLLASQGFAQAVDGPHAEGSPLNSYAWSMEWFNGALLVGTLRAEGTTQQMRSQIWRYTPGGVGGITGSWKMVYQSPTSFFYGPQDLGYRWMTVCNAGGIPRLYVTTMGSQKGRILYSDDGITFRQATTSGLNSSDVGYRPLVCFKDPGGKTLLITSPVGVGGKNFDSDLSNNPLVLATDNPISGTWRPYSPLRFGDSTNNSIFSIGTRDTNGDGYGDTALYAGISNFVNGAQVWKTSGCSPFPCVPAWTKIVDRGAGRPLAEDGSVQNWQVSHIVQHSDDIYVSFGNNATKDLDATAELIRISPDDSFELIIGQPRLNINLNPVLNLNCTPETIDSEGTLNDCPPISGRGAGFGRKNNNYKSGNANYFWHMLSYDPAIFPQGDGRLYVGTLDNPFKASPGFDLLASSDHGLNWVQVTTDGLGDLNQGGVRTIAASPIGMFIGGANTNWAYTISGATDNHGCAVWLGTCDPALARPPVSDPRVILKSTMPGLVTFDGQRYIAYDDENYPTPGDGKVAVTLESRSFDPFCGEITGYRWDPGDLTSSCGTLPGTLGTTKNIGPLMLCTPDTLVGGKCGDVTPLSTNDYVDYTFTLQVTDNDANAVCNRVTVRTSRNLPPSVTIETDPPAVISPGYSSVILVDFDKNGSQSMTLRGICLDPEGQLSSCTWSVDPGATFAGKTPPFTDADPGSLGTAYTATLPVGDTSLMSIVLTSVDNLGNKTALPVYVRVLSTTDSSGIDNPVCQGASRTLAKNTVLTVNPVTDGIGPRCADPEGKPLTYVVTQPSAGTGTTAGGSNVTYAPPQDFIGTAFFTFQACDPDGECSSAVGVRVNVQEAPPLLVLPPNAPATVSAAILTGRKIRVTWSNVADETRYEVQRCRRSGTSCSFSNIASNVPANTTFIDSTVISGGTYRFQVRACNANGCSAYIQSPELRVQ